MTRIPIVQPDAASPAAKTLLARVRERSLTPDSPLNLHAQMAYSPAVLASYLGVRHALEEFGTLDLKTRSAIMLTVSTLDGATYAAAVNSVLVARAGWTPHQIAQIRTGVLADDAKLTRLLDVVRQATQRIGYVDDGTWQAARSAGWTTAELADAFASVALTIMVDHFVHFAETPLDVPGAPVEEQPIARAS